MLLPTHYVSGGATRKHAHRLDNPYPIRPKLEYRQPACIVWLYLACLSFQTIFFCLVCGLLEKKAYLSLIKHNMGVFKALCAVCACALMQVLLLSIGRGFTSQCLDIGA